MLGVVFEGRWHFWSHESGLTGLLVVTLICLFFTCALREFPLADVITDSLFSLIIITGVYATFRQAWAFALAIALAVIALTLTWMQYIHSFENLTLLVNVFRIIFPPASHQDRAGQRPPTLSWGCLKPN